MRKFKFFLVTIISLSLISGVSMTFLNNVKADSSTVDERILDNGVIFKHEVIPTYYTDPDTEAERDFFSLTLPKSNLEQYFYRSRSTQELQHGQFPSNLVFPFFLFCS